MEMRPVDIGEEQWIRLRRDDAVEAWGNGHISNMAEAADAPHE
jgi:hypothetical protein